MSTALAFGFLVYAAWNSVSATVGVQVPAGLATSLYVPFANSGASTAS